MKPWKLARFLSFLLIVTVFTLSYAMPAPAQTHKKQVKLGKVAGSGEVLRKRGSTTWEPAQLRMALGAGNEIRVAEKSGPSLPWLTGPR